MQPQQRQIKYARQSAREAKPSAQRKEVDQERMSEAASLITQKHIHYNSLCNWYRLLYYVTRLVAGLCAGLLPFFVSASARTATALSIATLATIVFDSVFNPRGKWQLYSKATDLLMIARLKAIGEYDQYEESLKILQEVERESVRDLSGMKEFLDRLEATSRL